MTTLVSDIIDRAGRLLALTNSGETFSTQEYSYGLSALNSLIDSWAIDNLLVYATQDQQVSLVQGQASYTVGPSGTALVTARPIDVVRFYARASNYDYYVKKVGNEEYATLVSKTSSSDFPTHAFYDPTYPNGTIYIYPVPVSSANYLRFVTWVQLTQFTATTDALALPPGYLEALTTNLAVVLAPEYETEPSPALKMMAAKALRLIRRMNTKRIPSDAELGLLLGKRRSNIITDEP